MAWYMQAIFYFYFGELEVKAQFGKGFVFELFRIGRKHIKLRFGLSKAWSVDSGSTIAHRV